MAVESADRASRPPTLRREMSMETDDSQPASTGATTRTLERSSGRLVSYPGGLPDTPDASTEPHIGSGTIRILAELARWSLFTLLVALAPVALIGWSAVPRVTSPSRLTDAAIEYGLSGAARTALVDQLSTELTKGEDSPNKEAG